MKSVQILSIFLSVFSPNAGKYGAENIPYLDTFAQWKLHYLLKWHLTKWKHPTQSFELLKESERLWFTFTGKQNADEIGLTSYTIALVIPHISLSQAIAKSWFFCYSPH